MANTNLTFEDVKGICSHLEKSPSKDNMKSSPIYSGAHKAVGAKAPSQESHFGHKGVTGGKSRRNETNKKDPYA